MRRRPLLAAVAALISALFTVPSIAQDAAGTNQHAIAFRKAMTLDWNQVFYDSGTNRWEEHWTLDGSEALVTNTTEGMLFEAGPEFGNDAHHAVLWTRRSFDGSIRIEYEYTRTDAAIRAVTILYIQATGKGGGEFSSDISKWSKLRQVPSMKTYFNNMNTYHISYAAYGTKNTVSGKDYIRARRYLPEARKGLKGTSLLPDHHSTGMFKTGVPYKITVIKDGDDLFMRVRDGENQKLCHWKTGTLPPISAGRVGLRHMYTRGARYRDFRIYTRSNAPSSKKDDRDI